MTSQTLKQQKSKKKPVQLVSPIYDNFDWEGAITILPTWYADAPAYYNEFTVMEKLINVPEFKNELSNAPIWKDKCHYTFLTKPITLKVDGGNIQRCFVTVNGAISIFEMRPHDLSDLNNINFYLAKLSNNPLYKQKYLAEGITQFFKRDVNTQCFDKNGLRTPVLPKYAFNAHVALKILGLRYNPETMECSLMIHVDQLKLEKDIEEPLEVLCIF